jgi:hypothetical protein
MVSAFPPPTTLTRLSPVSRWWRTRRASPKTTRSAGGGSIALVTANFGGITSLPGHRFDSFYYTDAETKEQADPKALQSWTQVVVPDYPRHDFNSRLRARYFKHQIHRLPEVAGHRWLVWADSCIRFKSTEFIEHSVSRLASRPESDRLLVIPHPDRATVLEEYEFVQGRIAAGSSYLTIRYRDEKLPEQMRYFDGQGWDTGAPLWCGTFWIVENSDFFNRIWDDWWDQNLRFGMMDQLSLPVLLAAHEVNPNKLDVVLWDNEFFTRAEHRANM